MNYSLCIVANPIVLTQYHGDTAAAAAFSSILYIIPPILQFVSNPIFGILSDRGFGRKPFLYLAVIGVLASKVVLAFSLSTTALTIATVVRGVLDGGITLVMASLVDISSSHESVRLLVQSKTGLLRSSYFSFSLALHFLFHARFDSHRQYTRNFGSLGMAIGIAFVLGPGIGAGIGAASTDPEIPFYVAVGIQCVALFFLFMWVPETNPVGNSKSKTLLEVINPLKNVSILKSSSRLLWGSAALFFASMPTGACWHM